MKDRTYDSFKKEISEYHKKGYWMNFPMIQEDYDETTGEHFYYIELAFIKKRKEPKGV